MTGVTKFLIAKFQTKEDTVKILKSSREQQFQILSKLSSSFGWLLYPMFNIIKLKHD